MNNITILFTTLLYHKYNNYSGPYGGDKDNSTGVDFTFVDDERVFKDL